MPRSEETEVGKIEMRSSISIEGKTFKDCARTTHISVSWLFGSEFTGSVAAVIAAIGIAVMSFALAPAAFCQPFEVSVEFGMDDLQFSKIDGYDLVEVIGDKCSLVGYPGEPWLPVRDVHVLLPMGRNASDIQVDVLGNIEIDGEYYIYPSQKPAPISDPDAEPFVEPIPEVYESPYPIPPCAATLIDTIVVRGYYVAVVRVYPIVYIPADGKLFLNTRIQLNFELEEAEELTITSIQATEKVFQELVEDDVVNPEDIDSEYTVVQVLSPVDSNDVKYLVICQESMFDEFGPLLDWKTKKGVPAQAISVESIYGAYSGADSQEKIKACIKDYVENKSTVWVVLAGDNTIIPDRDCYASVNGGMYTDSTIPTDLYYSCLDDMDWDDDGDGKAGEVGQDTIDMGPDVFVGRFPIRTASEATVIVDKTIEYEKNSPSTGFAEKMILCGDRLWNTGDAEGKSEYMYSDWIDPCWGPVRTRFYDTATDLPGGASYDLTRTNLNDQIADGYNFLHMATHGNTTIWGMETGYSYNSSYALSVNNPSKYVNVLTIACITNAFDKSSDPCLSEAFIRNPNGGAVSYIGSSRYGWGYATMFSHGPSFKYDRMFYNFLLTGQPEGQSQHLGAVYSKMKEYWAASSSYNGAMRWCQFGINLMGDPELCLYTADPSTFSPTYETSAVAVSQSFVVETGVSNALVCLYKGDEVYEYGNADVSGSYTASINPATAGTMSVTITAPNYRPYEGTVQIEEDYPPMTFDAAVIDTSIQLTWSDPMESGVSTGIVYIRRSTEDYPQEPEDGIEIYTGTDAAFVDADLTPGQIYYYKIWVNDGSAYDEASEDSTVTACGVIFGEFPPMTFDATVAFTSMELSWSDPLASGISTRIVYIRRSTIDYPENPDDGIQIYSGTERPFEDTSLTPGQTYFYRIWVNDGSPYDEPPEGSTLTAGGIPVGVPGDEAAGRLKIYIQHTSGALAYWILDYDCMINSESAMGSAPWYYQLSGSGDIDTDGNTDLIWRLSSGDVAYWLMNSDDTVKSEGTIGGSVSSQWYLSTAGDIDRDGVVDLMWRHSSGAVAYWLLNSDATRQSAGMIGGVVYASWLLCASGDIDNDGTDDMIWRNTSTGAVAYWLLNVDGSRKSAGMIGGRVHSSWELCTVGDIDGDGVVDLIWQHTSGAVASWLMNYDCTRRETRSIGSLSDNWFIRSSSR